MRVCGCVCGVCLCMCLMHVCKHVCIQYIYVYVCNVCLDVSMHEFVCVCM